MIHKLSKHEFDAVFQAPMTDASEMSYPEISIREEVEWVLNNEALNTTSEELEIHYLYVTPNNEFRHILCSFGIANVYLVFIINNDQNSVVGYHILDLNQQIEAEKT